MSDERPKGSDFTLLASFNCRLTSSLTTLQTNLQMIGFGPVANAFLCGTRCAISILWVFTSTPIPLNSRMHNSVDVAAVSLSLHSGTQRSLTLC
jgi:hypothetical protein